jgi:RNA polymerase sigma-70 factor (ECF subfamily)
MPSIFLRRKIKTQSDEELLAKYRVEGDIEILGQLYEKYMHLVYGVCLKYLEEREWAKDEVMNLFTKLMTAVLQQEIGNFKTWLYVVTKNHCLMLLRSRKSEAVHMEAMTADPTFFMENSVEMHPLEEEESDMERLRECIERLKEEQQGCIRLFFYEGCSYRQISERLGIGENDVKSYIQNGKRNLRICIESPDARGASGFRRLRP